MNKSRNTGWSMMSKTALIAVGMGAFLVLAGGEARGQRHGGRGHAPAIKPTFRPGGHPGMGRGGAPAPKHGGLPGGKGTAAGKNGKGVHPNHGGHPNTRGMTTFTGGNGKTPPSRGHSPSHGRTGRDHPKDHGKGHAHDRKPDLKHLFHGSDHKPRTVHLGRNPKDRRSRGRLVLHPNGKIFLERPGSGSGAGAAGSKEVPWSYLPEAGVMAVRTGEEDNPVVMLEVGSGSPPALKVLDEVQ
jgi:hypothetical protein